MTAGDIPATPRFGTVRCLRPEGFRAMAYTEWGNEHSTRVAICVHGLTRNGRDFDWLARTLAGQGYRVVCPDVLGRGSSDWLQDPTGYGYPLYMADLATLLARYEGCDISWIGTSMGGLLGMFLAAADKTPIRRLVMNDVGPFLPKAALERIVEYVGKAPTFSSPASAESYLRTILAGFGPLSDAQWQHLTQHSVKAQTQGGFGLAYDPAIALPLQAAPVDDVNLWPVWGLVRCPVLVIRGALSDLLPVECVAGMRASNPACSEFTVPETGHAPLLASAAEQDVILNWLQATE